jgi:hypothetical protein
MTGRQNIKWTEADVTTAVRMWSEGKKGADLAAYFQVSRSTISGLIARHRDKFEVRGEPGKRRPINWTAEQIEQAKGLWTKDGVSITQIARTMDLAFHTVHRAINVIYAEHFPPRAENMQLAPIRKQAEPYMATVERNASERYDFTRYQIEGTEPKPYWQLTNRQCHFPLQPFEAVCGPETPCCGQPNREGTYYCNTHSRLMHETRRVA